MKYRVIFSGKKPLPSIERKKKLTVSKENKEIKESKEKRTYRFNRSTTTKAKQRFFEKTVLDIQIIAKLAVFNFFLKMIYKALYAQAAKIWAIDSFQKLILEKKI